MRRRDRPRTGRALAVALLVVAVAPALGSPAAAHGGASPQTPGAGLVELLHRAGQVLVYVGILGASGLVLFRHALLDAAAGAAARRAARLSAGLAGVALLGLLLHLAADGAWLAGTGAAGLVDPDLLWRSLTSTRGAATGLAAAGLLLALAVDGPAPRRGVAVAGAALALLSLPLTGHTRTYGPGWLVVGSDVLHVLAGSVWFGGVLGLLLTLRWAAAAPAARTVARFSTAAAWVVLALAASGTLLAWRILPGPEALATTGYGLTLVAKVGVVACVLTVAAWNRYRLVPGLAGGSGGAVTLSRLRRTVAAEAALLALALAVTGLLVSQSPVS